MTSDDYPIIVIQINSIHEIFQYHIARFGICIFHGEKPVIRGFDSLEDEMDAIAIDIKNRLDAGIPANEICVSDDAEDLQGITR